VPEIIDSPKKKKVTKKNVTKKRRTTEELNLEYTRLYQEIKKIKELDEDKLERTKLLKSIRYFERKRKLLTGVKKLSGTQLKKLHIRLQSEKEFHTTYQQMSKTYKKRCPHCRTQRAYNEEYDAYYCPKCLYWTERICPDRKCEFCKKRPKYPPKP